MARTYLERKEAWAAKMRSVPPRTERVEGRLPPGQHTVKELPVLDLGIHPEVARVIGPCGGVGVMIPALVDHLVNTPI